MFHRVNHRLIQNLIIRIYELEVTFKFFYIYTLFFLIQFFIFRLLQKIFFNHNIQQHTQFIWLKKVSYA